MAEYLVKRAGIYYFRRVLPCDVRHHFSTADIWKSLKTKSRVVALRGARNHASALDAVIERIRNGYMTDEEIRTVVADYMRKHLKSAENTRAQGQKAVARPFEGSTSDNLEYTKRILATGSHLDYATRSSVVFMLEKAGIDEKLPAETFNKLCYEFEKAKLAYYKAKLAMENGDFTDYDFSSSSDTQIVIESKISLSEAIKKYFKEKLEEERADKFTIAEYKAACDLLISFLGDIPVTKVKRDDIIAFKNILPKVPIHINKIKDIKGKPVKEAINIAKIKNLKTLSPPSIEKKMLAVKGFFKWASSGGVRIIEYDISENVYLPINKIGPRDNEKRKAFSQDDLAAMASGLISERDKKTFLDYPERYWIQLIAIFSGLRLEEISQLFTCDIINCDGIWCFNADWYDEDGRIVKSLKTKNAKRIVPIHSELINLGFLQYYAQVKAAGHERLWMGLNKGARENYQRKFKDWFNGTDNYSGFKKDYITDDQRKSFHSTRHTVVDFFKQERFKEECVSELLGQEHPVLTFKVYGDPLRAPIKQEILEQLAYDVDFYSMLGDWHSFSGTTPGWKPPKSKRAAAPRKKP